MSFDNKMELSIAKTVELSDDALEGVSGGVAMTLDTNYEPTEGNTILVMKPSSNTLDSIPKVQVSVDSSGDVQIHTMSPEALSQAIANTEAAEMNAQGGSQTPKTVVTREEVFSKFF